MARVMLTITDDEQAALVLRARDERRDPRAQAAIELRRALMDAGYLSADGCKSVNSAPAERAAEPFLPAFFPLEA